MDEIATIDASVETTETPIVEATVETPEPEAVSPEVDETEGAQPEPGQAKPSGPLVENGRLSTEAKAALQQIRTTNPALAKQLQDALFHEAGLKRLVPGGVKEIQQMRQTLEQLGDPAAIERTREEVQYFQDLDNQFTAGDPRFVEALLENEEGRAGFVQLMPSMVSRWAEVNPEGYGAFLAQGIAADMQSQRIDLVIERLGDFVGDNPRAAELLSKLNAYMQRVATFAQKPTAPAKQAPKADTDDREQQLAKRERDLTMTEWRRGVSVERGKLVDAEIAKLTAGRKISDTSMSAIRELAAGSLKRGLDAIPNFAQTLDRYANANDREGFNRFLMSHYRTLIPKALKGAFDRVAPAKPGPKPNGTAATQQGRQPGAPAGSPPQGFTFVSGPPAKTQIDLARTTPDMIREGKAVLIGGKKVAWRK